MEKEGSGNYKGIPQQFNQVVRSAKNGDKKSMEEILDLFTGDIEYLSKYIMLPREDAIQTLKIELINIVHGGL